MPDFFQYKKRVMKRINLKVHTLFITLIFITLNSSDLKNHDLKDVLTIF